MAPAIEPRLAFDFNAGTGTSAHGLGSDPAELVMQNQGNEPFSLYGADGTGLTGKPGDFALDIGRTTQAMGADGKFGGTAKISDASRELGPMASFTVTGWFKAASPLGKAARIVEYTDPLLNGFIFFTGDGGMLSLSINKKAATIPYRSKNCFNENAVGNWVFFAVSYDSTKESGNVVFYGGTPNAEPEVVATENLDAGKTVELNQHGFLTIGNNNISTRPFHGMLDDIAIYSSEADGAGALNLEKIKEIYKANLGAVAAVKSVASERPLKIGIIGDSTVCNYPDNARLRGWGQMLRQYTIPSVSFINEAQGGTSTKTFPADRWQKILTAKPDFVLIQFGHNDAHGADRPESTNAATDYKDNLRRYIVQARGASIIPVLVTPPHRRLFSDGHVTSELMPYVDAMKAVAAEMKVPLIDLYEQSGAWLESVGEEGSAHVTVNRGINPEADDRTHFTKEGAASLAGFVAQAFPKCDPRLGKILKAQ
ncbi:MAG: GDSL-type esterase/lipase family protein [Chthoniobacteraceae bacterium]